MAPISTKRAPKRHADRGAEGLFMVPPFHR
jgi:hypothetical protein